MRGLRRVVINVPLLTPTLSSLWIGLVPPFTTKMARPLIQSRGHEVIEEPEHTEGMIKEKRQLRVDASPEAVFKMAQTLGGETGWLYANFLWVVRGYLDLLSGGVGYRKGRRPLTQLRTGDVVDFWRVEVLKGAADPKTMRLRAER